MEKKIHLRWKTISAWDELESIKSKFRLLRGVNILLSCNLLRFLHSSIQNRFLIQNDSRFKIHTTKGVYSNIIYIYIIIIIIYNINNIDILLYTTFFGHV